MSNENEKQKAEELANVIMKMLVDSGLSERCCRFILTGVQDEIHKQRHEVMNSTVIPIVEKYISLERYQI